MSDNNGFDAEFTEASNAEFKAWQRDIKRQVAESGLTEDEFVERWLDTPTARRATAARRVLQ